MKKLVILFAALMFLTVPCFAYHIEVLQVTKVQAFDDTYNGFLEELAKNGIVEGKNLTVKRHIIDASADAGIWKKIVILMKIKSAASDIVKAKPDLVMTISTPATKYSMDKVIGAGIPLVFSCVANPPIIGCPSVTQPAKGFTGATLYQDPLNFLVLAQMAKPDTKKIGLIHSDDDNAIAFAQEMSRKASSLGITVVAKQIEKSQPIRPAALELAKAGVDSFAIPLDAYYGIRNQEHGKTLFAVAREKKLPVFAFVNYDEKGALLYAGPDFTYIGKLSGKQAVAILKDGKKPESLPILKQEELNIYVDKDIAQELGIKISDRLLKAAKLR